MWHFVSSAPLTYFWLTVLLVTTIIQRHLTKREFHTVFLDGSTNLHRLLRDPLEVLIYSLLWIDWPVLDAVPCAVHPGSRARRAWAWPLALAHCDFFRRLKAVDSFGR